MNFLKNHPFAVEAHFENSLVLTFAVPKEQLQGLIPECLELDTFQDKWAFVAIAMVQTTGLRPKGFPTFLGNDFFLIGYRIFVRFTNSAGKRLRGLYILKSETDKKKMAFLGAIFTRYNYTTTDIAQSAVGNLKTIHSKRSTFKLTYQSTEDETKLPEGSPFTTWKDARKFAGPLPFTFSYHKANNTVLIIEGVRQHWIPQPVVIHHYEFDFLNSLSLNGAVLASAFELKNIPYTWKKGKIEQWH